MKITRNPDRKFWRSWTRGALERRISALEHHVQDISVRHNELYIKYNVLKSLVSPEPVREPDPDDEN